MGTENFLADPASDLAVFFVFFFLAVVGEALQKPQ